MWVSRLSSLGVAAFYRIKIWDIDNGDGVVYDNGLGDADDGDAAKAIAGRSIVIHKAK